MQFPEHHVRLFPKGFIQTKTHMNSNNTFRLQLILITFVTLSLFFKKTWQESKVKKEYYL